MCSVSSSDLFELAARSFCCQIEGIALCSVNALCFTLVHSWPALYCPVGLSRLSSGARVTLLTPQIEIMI